MPRRTCCLLASMPTLPTRSPRRIFKLQTEHAFTTPDAMLEAAAVQVFRVGGLLPVVDDDGHVSGMECCWM